MTMSLYPSAADFKFQISIGMAFSTESMRGVGSYLHIVKDTHTETICGKGVCAFSTSDTGEHLLLLIAGEYTVVAIDGDSGRFLFQFGSEGEGPGEFRNHQHMCVATDSLTGQQLLLVADVGNYYIHGFIRCPNWLRLPPGSAHDPRPLLSSLIGPDVSALVSEFVSDGTFQFASWEYYGDYM